MEEYAVKVRNLYKIYHKKEAVRGLDIDIHSNQIVGLIGSNGSGKTTFFKMCAGFENITSGSIEILGGDAVNDISIKNEVIYSMHDLPINPKEKLRNVLKYYQVVYTHFDMEFADKMVELFFLPAGKSYKTLSQGMKSIFNFICAMATRCKVTFLDEPFIGIDIEKRKMAYEILLRDYMEHPRTFIVSSHNLSELESVLSEMILINYGKLVFYEDMDTVREMLFRVDGSKESVSQFVASQPEEVVLRTNYGEVGNYAILRGSTSSGEASVARHRELNVTAVSPEDVCVYLTGMADKSKLEQLWN